MVSSVLTEQGRIPLNVQQKVDAIEILFRKLPGQLNTADIAKQDRDSLFGSVNSVAARFTACSGEILKSRGEFPGLHEKLREVEKRLQKIISFTQDTPKRIEAMRGELLGLHHRNKTVMKGAKRILAQLAELEPKVVEMRFEGYDDKSADGIEADLKKIENRIVALKAMGVTPAA